MTKMILFVFLACFAAVRGNGIIHPEVHHPQPYSFGYTIKDKEGAQHRQEAGNGAGVVHGNYGFIDNKGLRRQVDYVADHAGFRAQVKTNEPGTSGQSPAAVHMISNDPYAHGAAVPYVSRVNNPVVPALYESNGAHGFPTIYGPRAYDHGHHFLPAHDRHMFLKPVQGHGHHSASPLHLSDHHLGHHLPIHHDEHRHGHHMPIHHDEHHHGHHVPVHHASHIPAHEHVVPHHVPLHHPVHGHDSYVPNYMPHQSHLFGPGYMGGLEHGHPGAGHKGHGGVVNFGANLVGGVIKGYDTRFTNL